MHRKAMELATAVEGHCFQLEETGNLLQLFAECLEAETNTIDPEKLYSTTIFLSRLPLLLTLLKTIEKELGVTIREMDSTSKELYNFTREIRLKEDSE